MYEKARKILMILPRFRLQLWKEKRFTEKLQNFLRILLSPKVIVATRRRFMKICKLSSQTSSPSAFISPEPFLHGGRKVFIASISFLHPSFSLPKSKIENNSCHARLFVFHFCP
jgi:hypothetical protein